MGVPFKIHLHFIVLIKIVLICLCESALTPEVKKSYNSFISGKGLYSEDDGIVILNSTNFKKSLNNTDNAWLVEFYNSWCGHCHKFAPIWKSLAANIEEWRNVLRLAAIDCADEKNTPVCRDYDIMGYPTVKFFSANSGASNLGVELGRLSRTEKDIAEEAVRILQKEQSEGRGTRWPNILPYRSHDINNLRKEYESRKEVRYMFIMFVDGGETVAPQVILDLSNVRGVEIRFVSSENEVLARLLGVRTYPSLLLMDSAKAERPQHIPVDYESRESFRRSIKAHLRAKGFAVPEEPRTTKAPPRTGEPTTAGLLQAREGEDFLRKIRGMGDVVFAADLESALRYSLEHEVSSKKLISGDSMRALNGYLAVLAKYFPIGEPGMRFLQELKDSVFEMREIRGPKLKSYLGNLSGSSLDSVLSTREWVGCRGSRSYFRGYPCGVWTLFHYMTVSALRDSDRPHFDPFEVLEAMLGYVKHFFGCTQCSQHFQLMANRSMRARVTSGRTAVLWLWSAHNEVNRRLSNDPTEDPHFPKIQFPSPERCGKCRDSRGKWNETIVLRYLTSMYHQDNVNYLGSSARAYSLVEADLVGEKAAKLEDSHQDPSKKQGKDFSIFDISLCVILYIASALICVEVCLKFILRRKHRKKAHAHDLSGRV